MRKTITILLCMIAIISCSRNDYMDIPQSLLFTADCSPSPVSKAGGEALWSAGGDLVMPGGKGDLKAMMKGIKEGRLTRRQLMINASRVCRMAKRLALKDKR